VQFVRTVLRNVTTLYVPIGKVLLSAVLEGEAAPVTDGDVDPLAEGAATTEVGLDAPAPAPAAVAEFAFLLL
jgi:hypothetical protein